jgi:hypothetical protein
MIHRPVDKCPKCGVDSPVTDQVDVDVGPGSLTFDVVYTCPVHGEYWYGPEWDPESGGLYATFRRGP